MNMDHFFFSVCQLLYTGLFSPCLILGLKQIQRISRHLQFAQRGCVSIKNVEKKFAQFKIHPLMIGTKKAKIKRKRIFPYIQHVTDECFYFFVKYVLIILITESCFGQSTFVQIIM